MKYLFLFIFTVFCGLNTYSQVTQDNNLPSATNYVGFNGGSIDPLPIRNIGDPDINISSNGNNKFAITELATWNGLNGLTRTDVQRTTLGLQGQTDIGWSMLHLLDDAAGSPANLQRPWMNVGTSYTSNWDFMYTGLLERPQPGFGNQLETDAVIAWGCQDALNNADNFRFIFIQPTTAGGPEGSTQGLETMRITPWGNVGIGRNFNNNQQPFRRLVVNQRGDSAQFRIAFTLNQTEGLGQHAEFQSSEEGDLYIKPRTDGAARATAIGFLRGEDSNPFHSPTASTRLDVNGLTRIRLLPDETPASLIMGYRIPGANNDIDDQFLGRIDFPAEDPECFVLNGEGEWTNICDGIGFQDCRWQDISSFTVPGELDMYMGFDPNATCYRQNLIVGSLQGKAKLSVSSRTERDRLDIGFESIINDDELGFDPPSSLGYVSAITGLASGINANYSTSYVGVDASAFNGKYAVGVLALGVGSAGESIGVHGSANNVSSNSSIGIYGEDLSGTGFAIAAVGNSYGTSFSISVSDESIKTNIEDIYGASELLNSLQPKTYIHQQPENRTIPFSESLQYGFLAQEMQEVLPEIVKSVRIPEMRDSTGFIEGTSLDLLGIQYESIIPILVAGFKEQNATVGDQAAQIAAQNETIAALEAQLDTQADQLEEMQNNMQSVLDAVQQMQQKTNNCCTQKIGDADRSVGSENGNTGAVINEDFKQLELEQNVPNPFDDQTRIAFNLPNEAQVILEITDAAGRPLERLIDGQLSSGEHTTLWDGSNMSSGIYFYTLYADGELITKKMIKK